MKHRAFIALGSNLGNRAQNLRQALDALGNTAGLQLLKVSAFYETEPVGMREDDAAGPFINAAALVETDLEPGGLLAACLDIERQFGRKRLDSDTAGYRSRTLDMDILFFDQLIIRQNNLEIPHPRLHERAFVLAPLSEIAPDLQHPVLRQSIAVLYAALDTNSKLQPVATLAADTFKSPPK